MANRGTTALHRAAAAAVLAVPFLAILLVLAPYLGPLDRAPSSYPNDIPVFHAPKVLFLASRLREDGELPRWNPGDFAGMPVVGDPQAGLYNPLWWLLALRPSLNSFGWLIVASALVGALGFVRLARQLGCSRVAAAAGATAFVLGGKLLFHLVALGHVHFAPFFLVPWVLSGFDACLRRASAARIVATASLLALMLVSMHPQLLLYTAILLVASALLLLERAPERLRGLGTLAGIAVWSGGLAAVHLLPGTLLLGGFARSIPELSHPGPASAAADWRAIATGAAGAPEAYCYLGPVALFLALLGLARPRGDRNRRLAWGEAAVALAFLVFGLEIVKEPLTERGLFHHPARALLVLGLPVAVLTAFGVDTLVRAPGRAARIAAALSATAVLTALLAAGAATGSFIALACAVAAAAALALAGRGASTSGAGVAGCARQAAAWVVLAALATDLALAILPSVHTAPEAQLAARPAGLAYPPDLDRDSRIAEPRRDVVGRGIPLLEKQRLGLELFGGYNSLVPWRFVVYAAYASGYDPRAFHISTTSIPVRRVRRRLFDLAGVTHFLYAPERPGAPWLWRRAESPLPRAYLVPGPVLVPETEGPALLASERRALARLEGLDPRRQVMLHGEAARAALAAIRATPDAELEPYREVPIRERRTHRLALELETTRPGILVLTEPFFPGWRAWDAGTPLPVLRANGMFRALALAPGRHRIELEFSPLPWRIGRAISLVTLAASALVWMRGAATRSASRRTPAAASPPEPP